MQITRIKLNNWKNFRTVDLKIGSRLFLIGPNASGKSNFLDVFRFLRDLSIDGIRSAVTSRGGISLIRCLSATKNNRILIEIELSETAKERWRYRLIFLQDNNQRPYVSEETVWHNDENVLARPTPADTQDQERLTQTALEQISENQKFRSISNFLKTVTYLHLIPQAVRDPASFSSGPVHEDPFGRDFLMRVWTTGSRSRDARLRKISEALKAAVPQLQSLDAEMDHSGRPHLVAGYSNWRAKGATQRENQFSDGTLRLLGLLWASFEGGGPLLLEEPELSLHPEVVRRLPGMFIRINQLRKEVGRQTFISTHSPELLQDPGISAEEVAWLEPSDQGTVIKLPTESDRASLKEGLTAADVLLPKSAPAEIKQLTLAF